MKISTAKLVYLLFKDKNFYSWFKTLDIKEEVFVFWNDYVCGSDCVICRANKWCQKFIPELPEDTIIKIKEKMDTIPLPTYMEFN